ncbi:MAG: lipase maturation factor family protein, partial [Deltaproteobacteria bacterium]|nr:lipase maturation factor family protein [Deltaproteobacteria bacterium]
MLTRFVFQRALALVYLSAFAILVNQGLPLLGSHGLLPIPSFLSRAGFWDAPSVFHAHYSDTSFQTLAWLGLALSLFAASGLSDSLGMAVSALTWFSLWAIYRSFVSVGQTFWGFGWEMLLLETGFLAIFLGSRDTQPPVVVIWMLRWLCFRVMFGAGLIKIRGDECWRDLTCMVYHYETQPLPGPLSWCFHMLPRAVHRIETFITHVSALPVPFFMLAPWPALRAAG